MLSVRYLESFLTGRPDSGVLSLWLALLLLARLTVVLWQRWMRWTQEQPGATRALATSPRAESLTTVTVESSAKETASADTIAIITWDQTLTGDSRTTVGRNVNLTRTPGDKVTPAGKITQV